MSKEPMQIATLKVEFEPNALKQIVDQGRLLEFAEKYSAIAAQELKAQLLGALTKAGVGSSKQGEATLVQVSFVHNFDEDDFGPIKPHPWPWATYEPSSILRQTISKIVSAEVGSLLAK